MDKADSVITVVAPARLHMGFLDMNGNLGRTFGGLGLSLDGVYTRLNASRSRTFNFSGPTAHRAEHFAKQLMQKLDLPGAISINIDNAIPEHSGLGSGTQLALAVGKSIVQLFDLQLTTRELGNLLARGARSGIGLGAFDQGGFIVDGGRGSATTVPPLIVRLPFPDQWRIVLVFDPTAQGLSGEHEKSAFKQVTPMPTVQAAELCRVVLLQLLPALAEQEFIAFSRAITFIQHQVGDFFAGVQGGRYTSKRVEQVMNWLLEQGIQGVGQSSWGPTGFAFVENAGEAQNIVKSLTEQWGSTLRFQLCKALNEGARVTENQVKLAASS